MAGTGRRIGFYLFGTLILVLTAAAGAGGVLALVYLPELRILARLTASGGAAPAPAAAVPAAAAAPALAGTPAEFVTIILTAVTVVLAALAIILALAAVVGYVQIKNAAEAAAEAAATVAAKETAAKVAAETAIPVATRVAEAAVATLRGSTGDAGDAIAAAQDKGERDAGTV